MSLRRPEAWTAESQGEELAAEFDAPCENCGGPAAMGGMACLKRKALAPEPIGPSSVEYLTGFTQGNGWCQPWRLRVYVRNGCAWQTSTISAHELAAIVCQHPTLLEAIDKRRAEPPESEPMRTPWGKK